MEEINKLKSNVEFLEGKIKEVKKEIEDAEVNSKKLNDTIADFLLKKQLGESKKGVDNEIKKLKSNRLDLISSVEDNRKVLEGLELRFNNTIEELKKAEHNKLIEEYNKLAKERLKIDKNIEDITEKLCKELVNIFDAESKQIGIARMAGLPVLRYAKNVVGDYLAFRLKEYVDTPPVNFRGTLTEADGMSQIKEVV